MTTKSQIRKLDQLVRRLQLASVRRSKFIAPKLEKRTKKWYKKFFKINPEVIEDFEPVELFTYDDYQDTFQQIIITYTKLFEARSVRKNYKKDVLFPLGYEISGYDQMSYPDKISSIFNIAHRKARTESLPKPRFLYHVAKSSDKTSISKKGLIPRHSKRSMYLQYKSRVYFFTKFNVKDLKNPMSPISAIVPDQNFVVFRIDTRKFDKFNIFRDPEVGKRTGFVWTPTHIPAKALEVVYQSIK